MIIAAAGKPTIKPPWMKPMGRKLTAGLVQVRPAHTAKFYGLYIVFSERSQVYGAALKDDRLFVEIMVDGSLEVCETGPDGRKAFDNVKVTEKGALLRDGQPLVVDGRPVNLFDRDRHVPAEKIYTKLGEVPPRKQRATYVPPPDIWALPPGQLMREAVFHENSKAGYVFSPAQDSIVDPSRLVVQHWNDRLIAIVDGQCFGVVGDVNMLDNNRPVDLTVEAPALNYGPYYRTLIGQTIEQNDEEKLADLFLYHLSGARRSFKLIDLYARDHFRGPNLPLAHTVKLVDLWLEAVGSIENDSWYFPNDINILLGAKPPFLPAGMATSDIMKVLGGTMGLVRRIGAFSDRQFAAVSLFYEEFGRLTEQRTPDRQTLAAIRRDHYGGR